MERVQLTLQGSAAPDHALCNGTDRCSIDSHWYLKSGKAPLSIRTTRAARSRASVIGRVCAGQRPIKCDEIVRLGKKLDTRFQTVGIGLIVEAGTEYQ